MSNLKTKTNKKHYVRTEIKKGVYNISQMY
jgi:hypothetical protein